MLLINQFLILLASGNTCLNYEMKINWYNSFINYIFLDGGLFKLLNIIFNK